MTLKELLEYTDKIKPNAIEEDVKIRWASEAEGLVRSEIFGEALENIEELKSKDKERELTVPLPYGRLYFFYLASMIDFVNGESGKYNDSSMAFENAMRAYGKWYIRNH